MEEATVPIGSEGESLIPRARQTVMIVDDDAAVAEMYGHGLTDGGFKAVPLANASALFEALDTQVPDVLVLDWQLSGITGGEVLRLLRADARTASVPILFLSNHPPTQIPWEEAGRGKGALSWLLKVRTTPSTLVLRVRSALAGLDPYMRAD